MQYREEIDGLRAIAISSVVLFHSGFGIFSGGYIGVDIFFVLSGYLITRIISEELKASCFTFASFYGRRARRILPALFFMTFIVTGLSAIVLLPPDLYKYGKMLVFTIFFGANFRLSAERGYFDDETDENPLLHMWSLSVEEQFYLIWPVLLLLLLMRTARWTRLLVPALLVVSFAVSAVLVHWMSRSAFYHLPSRGWELLIGAILALGLVPAIRTVRLAQITAWAGIVMMGLPVLLFGKETPFPGFAALLPTLGCALVIHATTAHPTSAARLLSLKPVIFLGRISYSLYLWHWPLIALPSYLLMRELTAPEAAAAVTMAIALATFSWRYVERPFRRFSPVEHGPVLDRKSTALALVSRNSRAFQALAAAAILIAWGTYLQESGGAGWRLPRGALEVAGQKHSFQLETFCTSYKKSKTNLYECSWGKQTGDEAPVILWGDSHADHYLPGIVDVFSSGKFLMTSGCPPVTVLEASPEFTKNIRDCTENNFKALRTILAARPALVVIAGLWSRAAAKPAIAAEFKTFIQGMTAELNRHGSKVLILGQVPGQAPLSIRCEGLRLYLGMPFEECGHIPRATVEQNIAPTRDALVSAQNKNVRYYSPIDVFCDEGYCHSSRAGRWLYADGHHLNAEGGHLTAGSIRDAVSALTGDAQSAKAPPMPERAPLNKT